MYFVYIMTNRSQTLYIGVTRSVLNRAAQHKAGESDFTSRYKIDRLVYFECFHDVRNAIAREKQIKKYSRIKKLQLITSMNPTWKDLCEEYARQCQQTGPLKGEFLERS
jgi:putative endonuclease